MEDLIQKYYPIIQAENKNLWVDYAQALENSVKYLKDNSEVKIDEKVAATYVVRQLFLNDDNFKQSNVENIIDDFIEYNRKEYSDYMNGFALIADQFHADISFYNVFVDKTRGKI